MDYLKPEKYYNDLYDLLTINRGIEILKFWQELYANKEKRKELKDIEPEEIEKGFNYFSNFQLMNLKADRYKNKETTIKEWTERDKRKQDKLDNTEPPKNIKCTKCGIEMTLQDFKHLDDFDDSKPLRVLFVFKCPKCKKRRALYDTVVSVNYSRDLIKLLDSTTVVHELHEYPTGGHNITGTAFSDAMEKTVAFFHTHLNQALP
jgi:phage FluMu protein Com